MTKLRAIEILQDLSTWLNDGEVLHWSSAEIGSALNYVQNDLSIEVLYSYQDWLVFGRPFYYSRKKLNDSIKTAIETLKSNQ